MPLYEYQCSSCTTVSEVHHKLSDPAPKTCPQCGGGPLNKLISRSNFALKGGGWYTDGYGTKSSAAKSPDSATGSEASTDSPKKDSPPKGSASGGGHTCGGGCAH